MNETARIVAARAALPEGEAFDEWIEPSSDPLAHYRHLARVPPHRGTASLQVGSDTLSVLPSFCCLQVVRLLLRSRAQPIFLRRTSGVTS